MEEVASDTCAAINLEVWYTEQDVTDHYVNKLGLAVESYIGYVGREGLYTQSYGLGLGGKDGEDSAFVLEGFLPDGSFGVEELEQSFPGGAPDYGCNETAAQWNVSECVMGRWYVRYIFRGPSSPCYPSVGPLINPSPGT